MLGIIECFLSKICGFFCVIDNFTTISHGFQFFYGCIGILGIIIDYSTRFPIKDLQILLTAVIIQFLWHLYVGVEVVLEARAGPKDAERGCLHVQVLAGTYYTIVRSSRDLYEIFTLIILQLGKWTQTAKK